MVGSDSFQAADCDRLGFDTDAPARRLARTVAHAAENAWKDVRCTIDEIRFGESPLGDQTDVFGNIRVSRASPLTIDDAMVIVRISRIGRFHRYTSPL